MMSDCLTIEKHAGSWTFVLNRPEKMNALSAELVDELISGVTQARRENIPLLVFKGNGKNFSAGFDFTGYETQSDGDLLLRFVRIEMLLQLVSDSPSLTVAFAHGRNFGAGVDLFAVCKQRYCTDGASFRMPGLKFGLVLGTRRFSNIVGPQNAMSILGGAKTFTAQAALGMGFVQKIIDQDGWAELCAEATGMAQILDYETRSQFYGVLNRGQANGDMAALVHSAARPGLKDRIKEYLKG